MQDTSEPIQERERNDFKPSKYYQAYMQIKVGGNCLQFLDIISNSFTKSVRTANLISISNKRTHWLYVVVCIYLMIYTSKFILRIYVYHLNGQKALYLAL